MIQRFQAVKGMNDVLPADTPRWAAVEHVVVRCLAAYGYREIRMPMLESTALFARSIGEVTDIVEKEMYTFEDALNGQQLTLRPEGTASCVRAVIEHQLLYQGPQRLWYTGPMFRHERPQKGRYRQFHQFGVEALGIEGAEIDAELLILLADLWARLGLKNIRLELNTLGDTQSRATHRRALVDFFETHSARLDEESRRRLYTNPLRILDTKREDLQPLVSEAPKLIDYIDDPSRRHFEHLKGLLDLQGLGYTVNSCLVRGLDYYNRTVFEWVTDALGAKSTLCGGGRYDGLFSQLGGAETPACGFALGIERVLLLLDAQHRNISIRPLDLYLVAQGEAATLFSWSVARQLRAAGFDVLHHLGEARSFKAQLKKADQSGAQVAVIIGEDEARTQEVTIKPLRYRAQQQRHPLNEALSLLRALL